MKNPPRLISLSLLIVMSITGCSNLFFYPMKVHIHTPSDIGLEYRNVEFHSGDGTLLHGWWLPAKGTPMGTILYLHGNAENISTHIANIQWLPGKGYNVLIFDYRGYGKSQGASEIDGIIADAESAVDAALAQPENGNTPIIVYGQSLGGAIAVYAVAHNPHRDRIKALIVESGFSSYRQIAREKFGIFWLTWPLQYPLSWTISDRYSPVESVSTLSPIPLLLVYSKQDSIVPFHHGQQLYDAAHEPKELWLLPNGRHTALFTQPPQRQRLLDYLKGLPGNTPSSEQRPTASR